MEIKLFIPVLLGTVRENRESEKVVKFLFPKVQAHPQIETQLFDPREFTIPPHAEGQDFRDSVPEWRDAMVRADGLIIVSPEYNHGYPGSLKRMLDLLLPEYIHKAVGFAGVSDGPWGGVRLIEQLNGVARELGLVSTFTDLHFPRTPELFDATGTITDPAYDRRVEGFLTELVWMATVLRWGREHLPSKYHKK